MKKPFIYTKGKYYRDPNGDGTFDPSKVKNTEAVEVWMKAYKRQLDKGKMTDEDIFQSCRSWMGNYTPLMSRRQVKHIKNLYQNLFHKEITWKQQSHLQTVANLLRR